MRIVPALEPLEERHAGFGLTLKPATVEHFAFERGEEAFGHGVIVGIADRADRRHHARCLAAFPEGIARVLTAAIRMMDDGVGSALRERHVEGTEHQLGPQVRLQGPADDASRPDIEHAGEVEQAGPRRDVGDVGDPEAVRPRGGELAGDRPDPARGPPSDRRRSW